MSSGQNAGQLLTGVNTGSAVRGVLIGSGKNPVAVVANASSGLVLTANGPNADPTFQSASGGGGVTFPITGTPDITMLAPTGSIIMSAGVSGTQGLQISVYNVAVSAEAMNFQGVTTISAQANAVQIHGSTAIQLSAGTGAAQIISGDDQAVIGGGVRIFAGHNNALLNSYYGSTTLRGGTSAHVSGVQAVMIDSTTGTVALSAAAGQTSIAGQRGTSASASSGAVTVNGQAGVVTTESLTAATTYTLTLTNSKIVTTSVILVVPSDATGGVVPPTLTSVAAGSGSATIAFAMAALTGTFKIRFAVFN